MSQEVVGEARSGGMKVTKKIQNRCEFSGKAQEAKEDIDKGVSLWHVGAYWRVRTKQESGGQIGGGTE